METVIRVFVIYLFILVGLRVLGKREFGQLSPLELVSLLLIPELTQHALLREDYSVTTALIGLATLFGLVFLTSMVLHGSKKAEELMTGQPSVLVAHGQLMEAIMNKERVTPDEIYSSMHKSGLDRIEQVKWAVLESDGKISIVPEDPARATRPRENELAA